MKNIIIGMAASAALIFSACNTNNKESTEIKPVTTDSGSPVPSVQAVYACPMHPEVTGKQGDKCPKCGMDLKEEKKTSDTTTTSSN